MVSHMIHRLVNRGVDFFLRHFSRSLSGFIDTF